MLYSILLILALIGFFRYYKKKSKDLSPEQKKKLIRIWFIVAVAVAVAILAFAKGNVIAGAIASLVALFSRALPLIRFAPLLKGLFSAHASTQNQQQNTTPVTSEKMDKAQAADVLGVDINASKEEIIAAHKRLIQKVHPDKGGSDALAVHINTAKAVMLSD